MGLGILEAKRAQTVSGTTRYYDDPDRPQVATSEHVGLKVDPKTRIILIPQPSDDPNDPLNWSLLRRDSITLLLCWAGILATSLGSILAANTITLLGVFDTPTNLTDAALLTGWCLMGAGVAAIFCVPSGRVWGKRHIFIIGLVFVVFSCVWAAKIGHSYKSMVAARVFQGVGFAPFESMLNAAIGDLYFVHERGVRMAVTNLAVFGSAFFTPIVVGKITESLGWEWSFYFVAIFTGATLPAVFIFCPETAYRRNVKPSIDTGSGEEDKRHSEDSVPHSAYDPVAAWKPRFVLVPTARKPQLIGDASTPPKSWIQSMSLFDGTKTDDRYWTLLLRPFVLIGNPAFIWACLVQGTMIGWTIFIGVVVAALFIGPPYYWGEVKSGYAYTSAFLGALGGFLVSGVLADSTVIWLTKRNKGVYEPEFRLFLIVPMLLTCGIGLFGFALTAGDVISGKYTYILPLVFFGFEVGSMVIGAVASSLYIVDAYRDIAVEGFTLMIIFKNFFSFFLTFYAFHWLSIDIKNTMLIVAGVQVAVCLSTVPLYIWGKRCRAFYQRHDLLAMTHLD